VCRNCALCVVRHDDEIGVVARGRVSSEGSRAVRSCQGSRELGMRRCHISPVNLSQIVTKSLILQVIDTALPGVQNRYDRSNGSSAIESPGGVEPPRPVYFCFSIVDDFLFVLYRSSRGWDAPSRCTSLAGTILGRLFYGIVVFRYLGTKGDRPVRLDVFTTSLALSQLHDPTKTHRPFLRLSPARTASAKAAPDSATPICV
jgi:hypothetical protein